MKDTILIKAAELFTRHGIKGVTMDDVARHLSVSKKTLYQHYTDKDELVESMVKEQVKMTELQCTSFKYTAENAVDELILIMEFMNQYFSQRNPTAFHDLQKYHTKAWGLFLHHKEHFLRKGIEENLKRGIKEKLFHADLNIKIVSKLRMEQIECVFDPQIFPINEFNIQQVHVHSMKLYAYGITTIKGHQLINKYLSKLNKKKQKI